MTSLSRDPRSRNRAPAVAANQSESDGLEERCVLAIAALDTLEDATHEAQVALRRLSASLEAQMATLLEQREALAKRSSAAVEGRPLPLVHPHGSAGLKIYCFGRFQVSQDDELLTLSRSCKASLILKYLATTLDRPVHRDVLLEILWPEADPDIANNRLKVAMHHLRQSLAGVSAGYEDLIQFADGCYLLNPNLDVWVDVIAFEESWHAGRRLERAGKMEEAIEAYVQAEALYRGDFLEEDCLEDWTLLRREELKDTYLTMLDHLSACCARCGNLEQAIENWKKILAKDPWREDAYRHLMLACTSAGNRRQALHWYEVCAEVLKGQLGIDPEPDTAALYERIRTGDHLEALDTHS